MTLKKEILKIGEKIDSACDKNDKDALLAIIIRCKEILNKQELAIICYFLANAYSSLRKIKHKSSADDIWKFEQAELFQEIYYFRRAILANDFDDIDIADQTATFTNLGNSFSHYGRPILALEFFDKALSLNKNNVNFAMALCNKAKCLESYEGLNYDLGHKDLILRDAYFNYKNGYNELQHYISGYDSQYYQKIRNDVFKSINKIEGRLTKERLKKDTDLNDYQLRKYKNGKLYRRWVLSKQLFLNPINDLDNFNTATYDPLNLPNLTTEISRGFPKYITYFNQIKQEYISYRVLLYEGLELIAKGFYDKEKSIIDDYDYNLYNIHIEKIKLSFRGFYSLLDKIANFINQYFDLGIKENQVSFRKIWKDKDGFKNPENLALRGLYLISKDLYFDSDKTSKEFIHVAEPEAKEINKIRNYLEHQFISVKMWSHARDENSRERCFYITQDDLENKTIKLAKLTREAIIYLSFAVHIEELKKNTNNGIVVKMPVYKL